FDGHTYQGFAGDTLASALLANDVRVVARSVTYGRPRGVFSAGSEEPNALVQVGSETMLRATQLELVEGLAATGLNGKGRLTSDPETARFDKIYAHCEVLVVGGGPAGRSAAQSAARTGDRVILLDEQPLLNSEDSAALPPNVRVLLRTTAFGLYDQNLVLAAERRGDGGCLWQIRARQVVLATGAHERPLVFAHNDRPGVMLAGAVRTYLNRYGVRPGGRALVLTTNDAAYAVATDLAEAGVEVAALLDTRPEAPAALARQAAERGIQVLAGHAVTGTSGEQRVCAARVGPLGEPGGREVACDLLAVSGGWSPAVHLFSQAQGTLRYDPVWAAFVPEPA